MQRRAFSSIIYIAGLGLLVLGLPTSRFLMSISQFTLLFAWIFYGIEETLRTDLHPGWKWPVAVLQHNFSQFYKNKSALLFTSIYLLHVIGVLWSTDYYHATRDLRIKLPLLIFPVIMGTMPTISKKAFTGIIIAYLAALFCATTESMYILYNHNITDIRQISPHISHVRLALNIVLGIFLTLYLIYTGKSSHKKWQSAVLILLGIWFILYLFIMKSPTGIIVMGLTGIIMFTLYALKTKYKYLRNGIIIIVILLPIMGALYIKHITNDYREAKVKSYEMLDARTPDDGCYSHDTVSFPGVENGQYIGYYLCEMELRKGWNERSTFSYDGKDKKGQQLKFTLIRYLNSKGLRKDLHGIRSLSDSDIEAIEGGVANYYYISKFSIRGRIYQMLFGYDLYQQDKNPNGNSMLQRMEYWKAGVHLLGEKPIFGVGTGDLSESFKSYYEKTSSNLLPEYRHRAHNQYLSITIAFGLLGFIIFVVAFLYPPYMIGGYKKWYFNIFLIIVLLSMITEDTLETQAGVTFVSFFYSFFVWAIAGKKRTHLNKNVRT